jgi:hypothetical protein
MGGVRALNFYQLMVAHWFFIWFFTKTTLATHTTLNFQDVSYIVVGFVGYSGIFPGFLVFVIVFVAAPRKPGERTERLILMRREQLSLKKKLLLVNDFAWTLDVDQENSLKYIAGVDISFVKGTDDACAALVVLEYPSLSVRRLSRICHRCHLN